MKLRKLILGITVAIAVTASFAFKANQAFSATASVWDPTSDEQFCVQFLLTNQVNCAAYYTGAQCTAYYNSTYPSNLAYANDWPGCEYPLYNEFH